MPRATVFSVPKIQGAKLWKAWFQFWQCILPWFSGSVALLAEPGIEGKRDWKTCLEPNNAWKKRGEEGKNLRGSRREMRGRIMDAPMDECLGNSIHSPAAKSWLVCKTLLSEKIKSLNQSGQFLLIRRVPPLLFLPSHVQSFIRVIFAPHLPLPCLRIQTQSHASLDCLTGREAWAGWSDWPAWISRL